MKRIVRLFSYVILLVVGSIFISHTDAKAYCYIDTSEWKINQNLSQSTHYTLTCYAEGDLPEGYYFSVNYNVNDISPEWGTQENDSVPLELEFLQECSNSFKIELKDADENTLDYTYVYYKAVYDGVMIYYHRMDGSDYMTDIDTQGEAVIASYEPYEYWDVYYDRNDNEGYDPEYKYYVRTLEGWNTKIDGTGTWFYEDDVYEGEEALDLYPQYLPLECVEMPVLEDKEDVVFAGWGYEPDSEDYFGLNSEFYIDGNRTFYAQWKKKEISEPVVTANPTPVPTQPTVNVPQTTKVPQTKKAPQTTSHSSSTSSRITKVSNTSSYNKSTSSTIKQKFTKQGIVYKIVSNTAKKRTVAVVGVQKKNQKKYNIPDKVSYAGKSFKVVQIRRNAFKGCGKTKYLYIRSMGIQQIQKGALNGLSTKCNYKIVKARMKKYRKMILNSF